LCLFCSFAITIVFVLPLIMRPVNPTEKIRQINIDYFRLRSIIIDYCYRIPSIATVVMPISKVIINVRRSSCKMTGIFARL
jgi:hypothetical protein